MSAFSKIEVEGAYRGTVLDATVGKTTNGYPQAILRFRAEEGANEMGEFEALGAQTQITAYFVLFNNLEVFNEQTANLNYVQLQKIGKWEDGKFSFREIPKLNGKKCFFRTALNTYKTKAGVDKTAMQVAWVDEYDSDGTTTLKPASDAELSALDALVKFTPTSAPTTAAKRGRPAKPPVEEKKPDPTTAVPATVVTTTVPVTMAPPTPVDLLVDQLPAECSKQEAWEYLYGLTPNPDDDAISAAWLKAIKEIGGDQKAYTSAQWASVRDKARGNLIPY
jgi:hypothetical protein